MPGTTVERICLPRISSGSQIIAHYIEQCPNPWKKVNVLGVERAGLVPIRVHEPDDGITLLEANTLDTTFPEDRVEINHVHFTDLDYNIQRLWDYDGLWEKDSDPLKLGLDETWIILDQNENIAMLRKNYPETIPQGYKRAKILPFNCYTFNTAEIKIASLRNAVKTLNSILDLIKPVEKPIPVKLANSTIDSTAEPLASNSPTIADTPTLASEHILPTPQVDNRTPIITKLILGKDLTDDELKFLKSDDFIIHNHDDRLQLIDEGRRNRMGWNYEPCLHLGLSKTILSGLTVEQLRELDRYAKEQSGGQDYFANGLAENEELKRLLTISTQLEQQASAPAA